MCEACGRGSLSINLRSKSENAVKSRQKVNLQIKKVDGKRVKICTSCMRTLVTKPQSFKITKRKIKLANRKTKQKAVK
ncbi:MAG: hypothetical protein UX09_C0001G0003 [Candidatus Uhrbacteria bacterium GW2011_GWE2_45_35]|uniref:50S ribosomal protein L28 n=2 Tax=Candidatus Uhriibacteriota TaxID=1752732 RepID=A0A0G1J9B8_9BACT|nr:MAG: hypothetical protein UW63_C0091G0003 [Candidatus Uhrbacteria bacterium GW2011_GWF2_44_350]KKU09209.1 MAG: hypothetical protein UX09_C0001G0003 [Candidatus Uhrbacteria bacterium GW2011_GWE2_45_35]